MSEERMSETDQRVNQEASKEHWHEDGQDHPEGTKGFRCSECQGIHVLMPTIPAGNH